MIQASAATPIAIPSTATLLRLFAGGLVGLLLWEVWARVITRAVLGFPLEPAGLIDALFQHNLGLSVPLIAREAMHYVIGIVGYPVFYYLVSRYLKNWSLVLDAIVLATFALAVGLQFARGTGAAWHLLFFAIVVLVIAARFIHTNARLRDSLVWGNFTWFNALGLMAPLGGLSFYILNDSAQLSFMSFVGHVIYGAVAAYLFETWEARGK
jgi:hypothetical protein